MSANRSFTAVKAWFTSHKRGKQDFLIRELKQRVENVRDPKVKKVLKESFDFKALGAGIFYIPVDLVGQVLGWIEEEKKWEKGV